MREIEEFDDDEPTPWTEDGRARLLAAGAELAAAVVAHAAALASATSDTAMPELFEAGDDLVAAVLTYVDAQFEYTGTEYPLGAVADLAGDELDESSDDDDGLPTSGVTVLRRTDYGITDEAAVLAAGRAAYKLVWPADKEGAAAADVTTVGRALYQIAHAHGWDAVGGTPGVTATGAATVVHGQTELLGPDPDEWPHDLFDVSGPTIHDQRDIYS